MNIRAQNNFYTKAIILYVEFYKAPEHEFEIKYNARRTA